MIESTVGRAIRALEVLNAHMNERPDIPSLALFSLAGLVQALTFNSAVRAGDKVRVELADKFGERKDGMFAISPEKLPDFNKEYEPVAAQKARINIKPVPVSAWAGIKLSVSEATALLEFTELTGETK